MRWENIQDNYFVSDTGVVRNGAKIMKQSTDKDGYKFVNLYCDNKHYVYKVHRLVAICFIDNPDAHYEVDHIDLDKTNNKIENLRWIDHSENLKNRKSYSKTGYKFLTYKKNSTYVIFKYKTFIKGFKLLEDAIQYRNQYFIDNNIEFDAVKFDAI